MARNNHPEATRERILDAAQELFTEQGYEHTSIQNILDKLQNLSKGAIYHHFKSKQDILEALGERDFSQTQQFSAQITNNTELSAIEKLRAILRENLENSAHIAINQGLIPQLEDPMQLAQNFNFWQNDLTSIFETIIREGNSDGTISCPQPHETASVFCLLANYWVIQVKTREQVESRVRYLAQLLKSSGVPLFTDELLAQAVDGYSAMLAID